MINTALLRGADSRKFVEALKKKEPNFDVDKFIRMDEQVCVLRSEVEGVRAERNSLSSKGASGVTDESRARSVELGRVLKQKEKLLGDLLVEFQAFALRCPNIPKEDVPEGGKEANKSVRSWGEKSEFGFEVKNHLQINEVVKWIDFERAAAMSGAQFALYRRDGVRLVYALARMMLKHNAENGFEPVLPPFLVTRDAMQKNGSLPKFEGDFYNVSETNLSLIPTAEVSLTNLYAGDIFDLDKLPVRHTAYTSCFRREAGGYGASERGLIRIHQFNKVELYSICHPDESNKELEFMVSVAEGILQKLGLHYRVSLLAAQDTSFVSAKTYDLEVWLPGQNAYYEVSSCSNATDFQARRAKIRFRPEKGKAPSLVHTLNASSLALPRLIVALMENYQQADGTIVLPDVLQQEMDALW